MAPLFPDNISYLNVSTGSPGHTLPSCPITEPTWTCSAEGFCVASAAACLLPLITALASGDISVQKGPCSSEGLENVK